MLLNSLTFERESMKTVLIAEDDLPVRQGLAEVLRRSDWEVTEACDGKEAAELFQNSPTNVVLTDLMMPKLDGMGLMAEVHAFDPEVPIVVLTGHASIDRCRSALKAGAVDFIPKPCEAKELNRVLTRAIEKRQEARNVQELQTNVKQQLFMSVPADISKRPAVVAQIAASAVAAGLARKHSAIRLAADEAFTNAVVHGSGSDVTKMVEIDASFEGEVGIIKFEDEGAGFDPSQVADAPLEAVGGRGIFLMRSFCDDVKWINGGRTCILTFNKLSVND